MGEGIGVDGDGNGAEGERAERGKRKEGSELLEGLKN